MKMKEAEARTGLDPEECGQSAPFDGRGEDLSEDEEEKRAS